MLLESPILANHPEVDYLEDIKTALNKVNPIYFSWCNHKIVDNDSCSEELQQDYCERVFAYELYHQIRCVMYSNPIYQNVYLNGETIKRNKFFTDIFDTLPLLDSKFHGDKKDKCVPDLVLHKDLGSIEKEGQIYLAEIKMAQNKQALDDLWKLTLLKSSKLEFTFYIFIYVGKDIEEFRSELSSIDISKLSLDIVCICTKYGQSKCMTLGEVLENK